MKRGSVWAMAILAAAVAALAAPAARAQDDAGGGGVPGMRVTAKGELVVPMVFPVLGGSRWSDTWGAPRGGGTRAHQGQDLPGPKMRPLLACFDGVWTGGGVRGDNGCYATYLHLNNDTPGTDDGRGGEEFRVAPGVRPGTRVRAGQHVAYCGDSGNAEETISHLHFELSVPGRGTVNAAASLRAATVLKEARPPASMAERPDLRPESPGELRIDAEVVSTDPARGVALVRVAAWRGARGNVTPQTRPTRRWVRLPARDAAGLAEPLSPGDVVAVIAAADPGDDGKTALAARRVARLAPADPYRSASVGGRSGATIRTSASTSTSGGVIRIIIHGSRDPDHDRP